ncbi:MAG: family transposase [Cyanobacteriota bacterium]|jgi:putative transposase
MANNYYRREKHSVSRIHLHLVFVTKYRRKCLNLEHLEAFKEIANRVAKSLNFEVIEVEGESDHVHLLIEIPPKLSVSQAVNSLKGVSSRMLRKEFPALRPHPKHLWSPSYFAISCGGAPIEKIKEYIQNQSKPS